MSFKIVLKECDLKRFEVTWHFSNDMKQLRLHFNGCSMASPNSKLVECYILLLAECWQPLKSNVTVKLLKLNTYCSKS